MSSYRDAVEDELLVEAAAMLGFEQLQEIIAPSGFVALPADELRYYLSQLGYLEEWDAACLAAAGQFSCPDSYEEIAERNQVRNRHFLDSVACVSV